MTRTCGCSPATLLHLRYNPSTDRSQLFCFDHAKAHDEGHGFDVFTKEGRMIEYLTQLIAEAEDNVKEYEARAAVHGPGPDARNVADRIVFHQGQVSGLRHALFALTCGGND